MEAPDTGSRATRSCRGDRHRSLQHGERGDERAHRRPDGLEAAGESRRRSRTPSRSSVPTLRLLTGIELNVSGRRRALRSFNLATMEVVRRRLLFLLLSIVAVVVVLGFVFAGSPTDAGEWRHDRRNRRRRPKHEGRAALLQRAPTRVKDRPVVFLAGGRRYSIRPSELGVEPTGGLPSPPRSGRATASARSVASQRLDVQVFGADVTPADDVLHGALEYQLGLIAKDVNREPQDAELVRHGLRIDVRTGAGGPRPQSARRVRAPSSSSWPRSSGARRRSKLPFRIQPARVGAAALATAAHQARARLSAPVQLRLGKTAVLLSPAKLARLLELPAAGLDTARDRRLRGAGLGSSGSASASSIRRGTPGFAVVGSPRPRRAGAPGHPPRRRRHRRGRPARGPLNRRPALRFAVLPVQ